ncbi:phosphoribosylanthranilate isomerase [bacterium]|nr:phosphoribosylanthranilate isomerase [bacterium]
MCKIKICGITNLEDALCVRDAGADYIGYIFYKNSPRYTDPELAGEINKKLDCIIKVGVFVNEDPAEINKIKKQAGLDFIQLHGDEKLDICCGFALSNLIKVLRVKDNIKDFDKFLQSGLQYILLDTYNKETYGGTGESFNWDLACEITKKFKGKIFLSGGINIFNVKEAVKIVKPYAVDVSSGVEIEPGKKDHDKVREIVSVVKILKT